MELNPKVNFFFTKSGKWQAEVNLLRNIIAENDLLTEELKWGCPCYTYQNANIVLIHTFKEYCAMLFFKGVLLPDPKGLLIQQTANVQGARQVRFTGTNDIIKYRTALKSLIKEAMKAEKSGLKVELKTTSEFEMVDEFKQALQSDKQLKKAFESLTPGRQRGYLLHFSLAKQNKTRLARIEKCIPNIMNGKGLNN